MNEFDETIYPDMIRNLPDADIPFKGVNGKILQGENHQAVFFVIEAIGVVAEHSHGAQWGIVFEGEMDLTIDGVTKTYTKVIIIIFLQVLSTRRILRKEPR